ncbi:MAG: leucine-rich repeat domain-containing protein [Planctomycetota bacterium]
MKPHEKSPTRKRSFPTIKIAVAVSVLLVAGIGLWAYRLRTTEAAVIDRLKELNASFGRSAVGPPWLTDWLVRHNLPVVTHLAGIDAVDPAFCDNDLKLLRRSTRIGYLDLDRTRVTDAGTAYLASFSKLTTLELDSTQITDAGLQNLKGLTTLRALTLNGTQVTDAGLVHLQNMKGLGQLHLGKTHVTDEGLPLISGFVNLNYLDLSGTPVTDKGLAHLKSLKRLTELKLSATRVTSEGIADLKSAIPDLNVTSD